MRTTPAANGRRRPPTAVTAPWALGAVLLACSALAGPTSHARRTSSRPDRDLYLEAKQAESAFRASTRLKARRAEWEKVVLRYRRVVARYPQSGYCDDALLAVGDLYRDMAEQFKAPRYDDDAVLAYRTLVREYPSSSRGEQALYSVVEIAKAGGDRKRLIEAARAYLDTFPDAKRVPEVKALLSRSSPAALPSPPPPGLASVFNVRAWSGDASTRIVVDLEHEVPIRHDRISNPDRLWIDLVGTRLHPNLKDRAFPVGDGLLEQIRVGQNRDNVVRVVLEFRSVQDFSMFFLEDPTRLVIDVRGTPRPAVASGQPAPAPPASPAPASAPAAGGTAPPPPGPAVADAAPASAEGPGTAPEAPTVGPTPPPAPAPTPVETPAAPETGGPPASLEAAPEPAAPQPPRVNRAGSYSLARQLGLGARRIVIDAGHGGHDPGTIGRDGLQEKDLVLDVALRLAKLVRSELGAEVVMTRTTDVFVPLEERTAIANSKGADLFLSIHANSSRNRSASGIETYFLNFAVDPHAEEVAARENAISAATLKDLQGLVKAIALNSKIDESRDFAASVQEAMVGNLRSGYPGVVDRGVHTAPFYVLIGANMPSILAEIAFVSHPQEEKQLKSPEYREKIARSLLEGVRNYLDGLSRTQTRQLTSAAAGPTVEVGKARH